MNDAKIRLSSKEMELVNNTDWILTKNAILQKAKLLLEDLLVAQQGILKDFHRVLPPEVMATTPKISRGENYKGLPYLVLDNPRYFHRENIFAIRTMFWWGNFFSTTLHLSGSYKDLATSHLIAAYSLLESSQASVCIGEEEWEHHFDDNNYQYVGLEGRDKFVEMLGQKKFVKLAYRIPLIEWENATEKLPAHFISLLKLLENQLPRR